MTFFHFRFMQYRNQIQPTRVPNKARIRGIRYCQYLLIIRVHQIYTQF